MHARCRDGPHCDGPQFEASRKVLAKQVVLRISRAPDFQKGPLDEGRSNAMNA
jgi:hypothetical protein